MKLPTNMSDVVTAGDHITQDHGKLSQINSIKSLLIGKPTPVNSVQVFGIDTIKVGFVIDPKKVDFTGWQKCKWERLVREGEKVVGIKTYEYLLRYVTTPNDTVITLKFIPKNFGNQPLNILLIEFSFPKLMLGHNYLNISDWQLALDFANATISNISGLPPLKDIREATLYRVDICANLNVGRSDIKDYLQVLAKCKHPHRITEVRGCNVIFPSKEVRTTFYDKGEETKLPEAAGILRMEIQFLSRRIIGEWLGGKKQPTLKDFSLKAIGERLHKELHILRLDELVICDQFVLDDLLTKQFSPCKVRSMLGYWMHKRTLTREQMLSNGYTRRMIAHYEKLFMDAGVSSNSIDSKKTLPPLTQFLPETDKLCNKPLSDTRVIN